MDAIVVGHVCIDLTPGLQMHQPVESVSALMRPGALVDVAGLTVSPGGAVSNTGLGLARMGMDVGLIGRVGADPLAAMLRRELAEATVDSEAGDDEGRADEAGARGRRRSGPATYRTP
jgi:sugar/nucleoside kinase (ribokinase family)